MTDSDQNPQPSLLRHLTAMLYDGLLVIALVAVANTAALAVKVQLFPDAEQVLSPLAVQVVTIASIWGFFCLFWRKNGQTLGMQAWRLQLVDEDGARPTLPRLLGRCAGATLSWACLGLGYLWRFLDRDNLYWHDRLSGTRLVLLPKRD